MASKRAPREIKMAEIERRFPVESAGYWYGSRWCPPVHRQTSGGYGIRFVKSTTVQRTRSGDNVNTTFDYFQLDADGVVTAAPRGYAREFKPGRVVDIEAAVERYAEPQPDAIQIGGGW